MTWGEILAIIVPTVSIIGLAVTGVCCCCGKCRCCCKRTNIPRPTTPAESVKKLFKKRELDPKEYNGYSQSTNCYAFALKQKETLTKAYPGMFAGSKEFSGKISSTNPEILKQRIFENLKYDCEVLNFKVRATDNPNEKLVGDDDRQWMIAFTIWPETDFHWWRRKPYSKELYWIHKPGSQNIKTYGFSNANLRIKNPKDDSGNYTDFGGFYVITRIKENR